MVDDFRSARSEDVVDSRVHDGDFVIEVSDFEVTGDVDIGDITVDAAKPSSKVVPTPRVRIFEGVPQHEYCPLPSSQQNCPREGSPHLKSSTLSLSFTRDYSSAFDL